ncbi:MAG: hypothetical protein J0H47_10545 [Gammaproteobacteria bacterium]|nr:hypothetical protein [Gammaproteobacteria bacterium]
MKSLILGILLVFTSAATYAASCHTHHRHVHRCAHYGYGYTNYYYAPGPSCAYDRCGDRCGYYRYERPVVYYYPYRAYHGYYYSPRGWYWGRW